MFYQSVLHTRFESVEFAVRVVAKFFIAASLHHFAIAQ